MRYTRTIILILVAIMLLGSTMAIADSFATNVSEATKPALAASIVAAYFATKDHGTSNAARVTDSILLSYGLAESLKPNLKWNRDSDRRSFPSGHTATAFAAASSLGEINPKQKWMYYAGAALVGWSRVETGAHTWRDVLGGAAVGITIGKWSVSSGSGLMVGRAFKF